MLSYFQIVGALNVLCPEAETILGSNIDQNDYLFELSLVLVKGCFEWLFMLEFINW